MTHFTFAGLPTKSGVNVGAVWDVLTGYASLCVMKVKSCTISDILVSFLVVESYVKARRLILL